MLLGGRGPFSDQPVDLSLTPFVDDIAKVHVADTGGTILETYKGSTQALEKALSSGGHSLNDDRTVIVPGAFGPRAYQHIRNLRRLDGRITNEARYLGPVFGRFGHAATETKDESGLPMGAGGAWASFGKNARAGG